MCYITITHILLHKITFRGVLCQMRAKKMNPPPSNYLYILTFYCNMVFFFLVEALKIVYKHQKHLKK